MNKFILIFFIAILCLTTSGQQKNQNYSGATGQPKNLISESTGSDLNVFPNPVTNRHFWIVSENSQLKEVKLLNITGKEVFFITFVDPVQKHEVILPDIPDGIYILTVKHANNVLKTVKILVRNH